MRISVGNDLMRIDRVQPLVDNNRLARILLPDEISRSSHEHIAGRIALKEAAVKALGLSADDWLQIRIRHQGPKPVIELMDMPEDILSIDCSISHDGEYAIATVVVLYK